MSDVDLNEHDDHASAILAGISRAKKRSATRVAAYYVLLSLSTISVRGEPNSAEANNAAIFRAYSRAASCKKTREARFREIPSSERSIEPTGETATFNDRRSLERGQRSCNNSTWIGGISSTPDLEETLRLGGMKFHDYQCVSACHFYSLR